jgi:holo-[acyl-carrier protein] synthase
MSILGVGHDQVELARFGQIMDRFGSHFLDRCFTPEEIEFCCRRSDPTAGLAARFAAKEAAAKALGTGFSRGIGLKDIEVRRQKDQRPTIHLHGDAAAHAARLGVAHIHLSLTHSRELASAFVIIEGHP